MLGKHNPDMQAGLDSVFDCVHFDWVEHYREPELRQIPVLANVERHLYGFDPLDPAGTKAKKYTTTTIVHTDSTLDTKLLEAFNNFKPDYVFIHTQKADVIGVHVIEHFRKTAKVINWCGDVREPLEKHYVTLGKQIDLTLFTNMDDVNLLNKQGVKADFLQVGFDSDKFNPKGDKGKYPEIVFLGSNYGRAFPLSAFREEMVNKLKNEFGDKFGVYGTGWGKNGDGIIDNYAEEGKVYRSCKVAISLSHFDRELYASDRLFRAMGAGAFCMSHGFRGLEKMFSIGNEIQTFATIDDLITDIRYYLEVPKIRKKIAKAGCKKVRNNYTWINFAENLKIKTDGLDKKN